MSAALNDPHWLHERVIFERLLACTPELRVRPDSIRRGIGFDLACTSQAGDDLAFELTEITDQGWAASLSPLIKVPQLLNQLLRDGRDAEARAVRERYQGHDIAVRLVPGAGLRAVRRVLPRIFGWLAATDPAVVAASEPPAELRQAIQRIEPRHFPGVSIVCFHAPGQVMWIGDESAAAIRAKFEKEYPRGIGLQLLAYFHRQPARPDAVANVRAFLDVAMPDESFARVWLYDDQTRQVLLRYS